MTVTDKDKLKSFFEAVANVVVKKKVNLHHPEDACFEGTCDWCKTPHGHDWDTFRALVALFWKDAPEVSEGWKALARHCNFGFSPEELHDVLLGVFICGDGARSKIHADWSREFTDTGLTAEVFKKTVEGIIIRGKVVSP